MPVLDQPKQTGSFSVLDRTAVEIFARDTVGDLHKAATSMRDQAHDALHRMAATGVSNGEVNAILTGGVIEGQPVRAIRELRQALEKVHGKKITIMDKNGNPMEFDTGYYAKMVAVTKTREATCRARHARLQQRGIDLVTITGKLSVHFCTAWLGKVFSLSGASKTYPPLASTPGDGPPWHPNCSKGTAPFIAALADPANLKAGAPDPETDKTLNIKNQSELQRRFKSLNLHQAADQRMKAIRPSAGRKAAVSKQDSPAYQKHLLQQWGIKHVDLGKRTEIGAIIVRGIQQVVAGGGSLPTSLVIHVGKFIDPNTGLVKTATAGSYNYATGEMAFNPAWPGWSDPEVSIGDLYKRGAVSSPDPQHVVFHEAGHVYAHTHHLVTKAALPPGKFATANKVSRYATTNVGEFLAEFFAARMAGRKLPDDAIKLYQKLGGK